MAPRHAGTLHERGVEKQSFAVKNIRNSWTRRKLK